MKETRELLLALAIVGKLVVDRVKDGVQLEDAVAVITALVADPKYKDALSKAVAGVDKIDDEFKDFNLVKALELVQVVPELVAILKG